MLLPINGCVGSQYVLPDSETAAGMALCQNKSRWVELVVYSQNRLLVTKAKATSEASH